MNSLNHIYAEALTSYFGVNTLTPQEDYWWTQAGFYDGFEYASRKPTPLPMARIYAQALELYLCMKGSFYGYRDDSMIRYWYNQAGWLLITDSTMNECFYTIKNDEGEYLDSHYVWQKGVLISPFMTQSQEEAESTAREYGGHFIRWKPEEE